VTVNGAEGSRTPMIAGNWKMHKTVRETTDFFTQFLRQVSGLEGVDVVVCPPFTALGASVKGAETSEVQVYAQNMYHEASGAFTGEVAAPMLLELGVRGVILGHSERRQMFGETDRALQQKVPAALEAGLVPILCVGETEEEREAEETERKLRHQVQEALARVATDRLGDLVIAYEPIWAIGTGRVATPEQAQDAIAFIRALVADRSREQAARTRLLYGGSVNAENAPELMALPDVDGALVGGASLTPDTFATIVSAARA
jgi:triosephosphate isomerase (TIM)